MVGSLQKVLVTPRFQSSSKATIAQSNVSRPFNVLPFINIVSFLGDFLVICTACYNSCVCVCVCVRARECVHKEFLLARVCSGLSFYFSLHRQASKQPANVVTGQTNNEAIFVLNLQNCKKSRENFCGKNLT